MPMKKMPNPVKKQKKQDNEQLGRQSHHGFLSLIKTSGSRPRDDPSVPRKCRG